METKPEATFIQTNGLRLHVVQAGPENGPLVILLHGFPEFWYGMHRQIEPLASAGFRVWAPDQRGYNLSDKPGDMLAYHLEETTKDIAGLIEASGHRKASVVGHDWGGIVAWWLALRYPGRLERLAVLNAPHPAVVLPAVLRDPSQVVRSLYALFFQIPGLPEAILRSGDWELVEKSMQATSRPGTFSEADFEQYRRAWWRPGAFTAMLNWYRANFRRLPQYPNGQRVRLPVLILWGAQDAALSRETARLSAALCDQGRLVMFEEASHWVQHEETEEINQAILDFLRSSP